MKTLHDLFLCELTDIYDAERRIVKALPKMAKAATCKDLKEALHTHLKESEEHIHKLEQIFASIDEKPKGKECAATVGILKEAEKTASEFKDSPTLDAALISAAQKMEHYEIASYGCLHEWADMLDHQEAMDLLNDILEEEKDANYALTNLARASSNEKALGDSYGNNNRATNGALKNTAKKSVTARKAPTTKKRSTTTFSR